MKPATHRYGPDRSQVAEIWRPDGADEPRPVVALIHGGFWRQIYSKRLMHPLARAVVDRGWIAYNIEYRRVGALGRGGWPSTFEDISDALNALGEVTGADLHRVATCGHSAGGQLALWATSKRRATTDDLSPPHPVGVCAAVSLAGVVDLVAAARQKVGGDSVQALMGGSPEQVPHRYALGSPAALLPLGVPQFLIHGGEDRSVPASMSADYVTLARSKGDVDVHYLPIPGDRHLEMINPRKRAFGEVVARLGDVFETSGR